MKIFVSSQNIVLCQHRHCHWSLLSVLFVYFTQKSIANILQECSSNYFNG